MITVKVTTMDTELEFAMPPKTKGRELFRHVTNNLGLREHWYFGLMYHGSNDEKIWFDTSKKSIKDIHGNVKKLKYRVKYYPEDAAQELIEDNTISYFYLQVRSDILTSKIYCPPDTCVLLASYAAQARHGDYNERVHKNGVLQKEILLPERVYQQHNMKREDWEDNIINMWQKHAGMLSEDAMMEYLKLAQNLEMYGVSYFDIRNKKGTDLLLGVDALGLNIYKVEDRLNPTITFPWPEIKNINFKGTRFTIKPTDKLANFFVFYSADAITNKHILNMGIGNHFLYMKRRKNDSLEVQQMKAKAKQQKKIKLEQSSKLQQEILSRKQAEKREQEYQEEIKALKEKVERKQDNLMEAQLTIQKLQQQLQELQSAKLQLKKEQDELKEMMKRLEQNKHMEAIEKQKLEQEIAQKHSEILHIQGEVAARDEETRRLQEEIARINQKEEECSLQKQLREAVEQKKDLETLPAGANIELPSLVEVNEQLQKGLKLLREQLNQTRVDGVDTEMDKIHRENLRKGRDKYKTLNEIRKGNTVRRVDMFENM